MEWIQLAHKKFESIICEHLNKHSGSIKGAGA